MYSIYKYISNFWEKIKFVLTIYVGLKPYIANVCTSRAKICKFKFI